MKVYQVYGARVKPKQLYSWIVANKDCKWYSIIVEELKDIFESYGTGSFEEYVELLFLQRLNDLSPEQQNLLATVYEEVGAVIIGALRYAGNDENDEAPFKVEVFEITMEHHTDDIIIGAKTAELTLYTRSRISFPVEYRFPVSLDTEYIDVLKYVREHSFLENKFLDYYTVQGDCICCS